MQEMQLAIYQCFNMWCDTNFDLLSVYFLLIISILRNVGFVSPKLVKSFTDLDIPIQIE